MSSYVLSGEADADIEKIAEASLQQWSLGRAQKYLLEVHEAFQRLAEFPNLGVCEGSGRRLLRFSYSDDKRSCIDAIVASHICLRVRELRNTASITKIG